MHWWLALLLFVLAHPAWGRTIEPKSQVYASHAQYFSAADLFAARDLPIGLLRQFSDLKWRIEIPEKKPASLMRPLLVNWIKRTLANFNRGREDKIKIAWPNQIQVYAAINRFNPDNLRTKIERLISQQCHSCEFEIEFLAQLPKMKPFQRWQIYQENGQWRGQTTIKVKAGGQRLKSASKNCLV